MEKITVSPHLAIHHRKEDGTCGIYLRITIDRRSKYISLRKFVKPEHFDSKTKTVKVVKDQPLAEKLNRFIADEKRRAQDIIYDLQRMEIPVTFELFKVKFEGENTAGFIQYCRDQIKLKGGMMKKRSRELEESKLRKLEEYQKNVRIFEIDRNWLEKYRKYLTDTLHNKINTVHGDLRIIRKYIKIAFEEGLIRKYPFHKFKMNLEQVSKEYLTFEEIEKLQKKYEDGDFLRMISSDKRGKSYCVGKKYQDVLQHFLISCYTGLRHSDIAKLRYGHIRENKIVIQMEKGEIGKQKTVRIPLTKYSRSVLELEGKSDENDPVYSGMIRSRSNTNSWLKTIMKEAGIKKYLTFHCARHTFAINSILLGIPIEVVSELLGHSDLRTTQIYAKIVDEKKEIEMAKWDSK